MQENTEIPKKSTKVQKYKSLNFQKSKNSKSTKVQKYKSSEAHKSSNLFLYVEYCIQM